MQSYGPQFHSTIRGLQLRVNSSSLGPAKQCPRKYYYSIVLGLTSGRTSVHLTFGTLVHTGIAGYETLRAQGIAHEVALRETLKWAAKATWNPRLRRPWDSGHEAKNRASLLRTLVWYCDKWGEETSTKTLRLADGSPAVELQFEFDSGYTSRLCGEPVRFVGKLDRLVEFNGKSYVLDSKTTGYALDSHFVASFTPDNQFSLYSVAGRIALGRPIEGLILDAILVGTGYTKFLRDIVPRDDQTLEEWLRTSHYWLARIEDWAEQGEWPMNDTACGMYGGCEFRGICSASPRMREQLLRTLQPRTEELEDA